MAVCWGLVDLPHIAVTAILMWGSGDGAYTELVTRNGNDTATVPVANTAVLPLLHFVFAV